MSGSYHKVGSTLRRYILQFSAGSAETGLTDGDFTKELAKNDTGNQSTTGITISEVDATNNPGLYEVEVSGTTGFVSATGTYGLLIYKTADGRDNGHRLGVVVTNDGTGSGSWGDASFTATASDGRVTDGSNAVEGATVRIFDPDGNLWLKTTTDASGLWGPVYFEQNGTYDIRVAKSGYSVGNDTLAIAGSTATGPGADITVTLATSSTGLAFSTLKAYAQRQFLDHQGTKADTIYEESVNDALAMISMEKNWPWYRRVGTVDLEAPYETGTLSITTDTKTVTLSGGTWPGWAASGTLVISGQLYDVATRDSDTQLTLTHTWAHATISGDSYKLVQYKYDLPDEAIQVDNLFFGNSWPWGKNPVDRATLESLIDSNQTGQAGANTWAIGKGELLLWPYPSEARQVRVLYWKRPATLVNDSDEADWDPQHLQLLRRAIDYQVALRGETVMGSTERALNVYRVALANAMPRDKTPDTFNPQARDFDVYNIDIANRTIQTS